MLPVPVFILADRISSQQCVIPAKAVTESTIQLLLANCQHQESLPPILTTLGQTGRPIKTTPFTREYDVYSDSKYVDLSGNT